MDIGFCPFSVLLIIHIPPVEKGYLMGLKIEFRQEGMIMGGCIGKMDELWYFFVGIEHGMHFNATFTFAIKGFTPYTLHNGFKQADCSAVDDENTFK